jgi:DNA-binding transcriptional ArsR family regulator
MDKFAALAEPTRRSILEMLAQHGQLSATAIAAEFSVSLPAISQHLKILREAGLVEMEKRAQQHLYRLNPEAMSEFEDWARRLQQLYDQRFEALDKVLELEMKKEKSHEKEHSDR